MASVSFAQGLGGYLAEKKKLTFWERRVKKIVDAKPSARRTKFLKILESHARAQMGVGATEAIDWGAIDWGELLSTILKFLLMILPFFI